MHPCACWSQARRLLESELADERAARASAEEARARAEADRSRLQLGRDDLTAQVGGRQSVNSYLVCAPASFGRVCMVVLRWQSLQHTEEGCGLNCYALLEWALGT